MHVTGASMTLILHAHPLSSYCHKVLVALYEHATPFTLQFLDLGDPAERAAFLKLWPVGKMPVLQDRARERTVVESTTIIEYLALHYPGAVPLVPGDAELALEVRGWDRFFDLYLQVPMQKINGDRLRPAGQRDPLGVEQARTALATAYGVVEQRMRARTWAVGDGFTMADCAAAPALFYADRLVPLAGQYPHSAAYLERLSERPSYARALAEAQPYFGMLPV